MRKELDLEKEFTRARPVDAYGATVGFVSCKTCGACLLIDPDDKNFAPLSAHFIWHQNNG